MAPLTTERSTLRRLPLLHALAIPAGAVAACSYSGPSLQGHEGLQYRVTSYYRDHAWERAAVCPNPEMQSITASRIVEQTPDRVVMEIRYYWVDWSQASDIGGASVTTCRDWSERTFTFAPGSDGTLEVVGMTGGLKRS